VSSDTITIPRRFNGPPDSANGGYVCGMLAQFVEGPVAVRLKAPPPLDTALHVERTIDGALLRDGDTLVAEARASSIDIEVPQAPSYSAAEAAAAKYRGFEIRVFSDCFVCGPDRAAGDGLRIFAGDVAGSGLVASPWTPHDSLTESSGLPDASGSPDASGLIPPEIIWAALDCPSAFTFPQVPGVSVLGEFAVNVEGEVHAGEPHLISAWFIGQQGRKRYAGSALFTAAGERRAIAKATWIELPPPV